MSSEPLSFHFLGEHLQLLPEKAIFWVNQSCLIVADVHLGKVGHFRKAGIAIPKQLEQDDLARLSDLIDTYFPKQLIFLGDLFHSDYNSDWEWLSMWRSLHDKIHVILVRGNHDILNDDLYLNLDIEVHQSLVLGPFYFSHEPLKAGQNAGDNYVICGHIHPGVTLTGGARQSLRIPCFHFGKLQGILPAFGKFTGKVSLKNSRQDRIFGVTTRKVIELGTRI